MIPYSDFDAFIINGAEALFDFSYPIFDTAYKKTLQEKILLNLWDYEIGETPFYRWKILFRRKFTNIMPYYNQLYKSALIEFDPLVTDDRTRQYTRKNDGTVNVAAESSSNSTVETKSDSSGTTTSNVTDNGTVESRHGSSNTPQGKITMMDIDNNMYLSAYDKRNDTTSSTSKNVTDVMNEASGSSTDDSSTSSNTDTTNKNLEDYLEKVSGRAGVSGADLIKKLRDTFLNIDMLIVEELKECMILVE